jgi:hypothetical protein
MLLRLLLSSIVWRIDRRPTGKFVLCIVTVLPIRLCNSARHTTEQVLIQVYGCPSEFAKACLWAPVPCHPPSESL